MEKLLIERIQEISAAARPSRYGEFGFPTQYFRHDFDNVISLKPHPDHIRIYKDKYGHEAPPGEWTAEEYASVVLSHRDTHAFIESVKTLKDKGTSFPDYVFQIASEIAKNAPVEIQTKLNKDSARLINVVLVLDIIKSQKMDMPAKEKKILDQATQAGISALEPIIPDFDGIAEKSYRNLGYFELNPFAKRITCDNLNKMYEQEPVTSLRMHFELNAGSIYKDLFGPRLGDLSPLQRQIVDKVARSEKGVKESDLIGLVPEGHRSGLLQGLAELMDKKALSEQDGVLMVRGEEFLDWYKAVTAPRTRPKPVNEPDQNAPSGPV